MDLFKKRTFFMGMFFVSLALLINAPYTFSQSQWLSQGQNKKLSDSEPAFTIASATDAAIALEETDSEQPIVTADLEQMNGRSGRSSGQLPTPNEHDCFPAIENPEIYGTVINNQLFAEPWVNYIPDVKFSNTVYYSAPYSAVLLDADWATEIIVDQTPNEDAFAQVFFPPHNMTFLRIDYAIATQFENTSDSGQLQVWSLNGNGFPEELHAYFTLPDTNNRWQTWYFELFPETFDALEGKTAALIFISTTDNLLPGERIYLDNIYMTICAEPQRQAFLPLVRNDQLPEPPEPACSPPVETDRVNQNRGLIELGARCQDTLGGLDTRDYYQFVPQQTGNYTIHLQGLAQSSVSVFNDVASYPVASNVNGGDCRTTTGGTNQSVRCRLSANQSYVVLIDLGSQAPGTYQTWVD